MISLFENTVPVGTFILNSKVESLDSIAEILKRSFERQGYSVRKSSLEREQCLILSVEGNFELIMGQTMSSPTISIELYEQSDRCNIALSFVHSIGFGTSWMDHLSFAILKNRNVRIFLKKGYGDKIISTINECLSD